MIDPIERADAIKELAEYLMMDAQTEWAGTASEDIEDWKDLAEHILKDIPSAENKGEWKAKSIEAYELPEGQIVVEYDASGVGLISRECMEMLVDTLATNKPKQGEWIYWGKCVFPYECTQCHDKAREDYDFCPYCGARMVKK